MATLLSIPSEIRLMIYYLLFAQLLEGQWWPADILTERNPPTQILRVCKLILTEATPIFWSIPLLVNNKLQRFMRVTGVPNGRIPKDHRWNLLKHVTINIRHLNATRFRELRRMKQLKTLVIDLDQWSYDPYVPKLNGPESLIDYWIKVWRCCIIVDWGLDKQLAKLMAKKPNMTLWLTNEMEILGDVDANYPGHRFHELRWCIERTNQWMGDEEPAGHYDVDYFRCMKVLVLEDI